MSWDNETIAANMTQQEYIFNTTTWVSYDLAPSSRYCIAATLEFYAFGMFKASQFESLGDIFAAWLQSLLGNVITMNKMVTKIEEAD